MQNESRQLNGVYLFNAPFSSPDSPYISVPTLAAYLESQGVPCQACDLGQEFWPLFLTPEQVHESIKYVEERFLELNQKKSLTYYEAFEYKRVILLQEMITEKGDLLFSLLKQATATLSTTLLYQDKRIASLLVALATAPFFPSHMVVEPVNFLFSQYDEFSSQDIVVSTEKEFFYSDGLREILAEKLSLVSSPPRLIGISVTFPTQVGPGFFCARLIKKLLPDTHVVMGGAFISLHLRELEDTELFRCVDSFIVDDGETPLLMLYRELAKECPDFSQIPAMIWKDENRIVKNSPEPPLPLASIPPPDYTVFNLKHYFSSLRDITLPFRLSRGCYWQRCAFCRTEISFCKDYEQPAVEIVFENLCRVIEETGASSIYFSDESSRPDVLEFIAENLLERGIKIEWQAHTRFHRSLTRERFELFKQSGCKSMTLGLEVYNDRLLTLMDKGTNIKLIDDVLAANAGCLPLNMYMIVGFPSETEIEARAGYEKLQELQRKKLINTFHYSLFQLVYGSDIWHNPVKYGVTTIEKNQERNLFPEVVNFSGSGMSRKQATALYQEFMATSGRSTDKGSKIEMLLMMYNEVTVRGETIPLHYSYGRVKEFVNKHLYRLNSMPLGKMLESVSEVLKK
ncbi:hypothetical protein KAI46_07415 [bacterium]|nr:hypothetical protein [bacterium]